MIRNFLMVAVLLIVYTATFAGNVIEKYEWEKDRARYKLSEKEEAYAEYILKHHVQFDYVLEDNQFVMYSTIHRIVRVNNSEAIQRHNRIYISMRGVIELTELRARSINKDGKVVNFDKTNLKEIKDEESGNAYRIFAIEGVEEGSEIEYYYTLKRSATLYDRVFMQYEAPVKNSSFLLSCPKHLRFDFHSYNGYAKVEEATDDDRNVYKVEMQGIEGLRRENFSSFDSNRERIEYKLAYNTGKSNARMFTWDEAAKTFYRILTDLDKDDVKALDKFIRTLNDNPSGKVEERIRSIETKIKTTIQVNSEARAESLDKIESIIKYKQASKEGITKLFIAVFDRLNIQCQPVMTCSRDDIKFDGDFDSWSYLDEYVLNFPSTGGFLIPSAFEFRYPMINPDLTAQKALFIEPFEVGNVKSALSSIKEIPATDYSVNKDNLDIQVTFNKELTGNTIQMKREFGGCNATFVAPYYQLAGESDRTQLIEELVKQTAPDAGIAKWDAKTVETGLTNNFVMDVNFTSTHFVETAGPRILFKVGELIGPQIEMYREDNRMTEIENDFNRGYDRVITVTIPEGYQVRNPDDAKINVIYKDGDKEPYLFVSDVNVKNNQLVITIKEYYKEIFAPVSRYEDYRKVINAAADFNKVTLVLEKKR